jgi:hypothetical protein
LSRRTGIILAILWIAHLSIDGILGSSKDRFNISDALVLNQPLPLTKYKVELKT